MAAEAAEVPSLTARLARIANTALARADVAFVRRSGLQFRAHGDLLARTHRLGMRPATSIDVGAAAGEWTMACRAVFREVRSVLIEPLAEFAPALEALVRRSPGSVFVGAVAAERSGSAVLNVHADLVGSSVLREAEGAQTDGIPRTVPARSVDDIVGEHGMPPPFVFKVDTQGSELDVLAGSQATLAAAHLVVLEVSLLPFFDGGPLLHDVVAYMRAREFVVYDVFGHTYRPLDGALAQVDLAFVPKDSALRQDHRFATPEQREEQDRRLRAVR